MPDPVRSLRDFRGKFSRCFRSARCTARTCARQAWPSLPGCGACEGPPAQGLQLLVVAVDPERDSAELPRNDVPSVDPDGTVLRGTRAQTHNVAKSLRARYEIADHPGEIAVDHTASTYLIDANGKTRILAPYDQAACTLADDVFAPARGR